MENKRASPRKIISGWALWTALALLIFHFSGYSQIPQDIPNQSAPTDFSNPLNIVLYIVLPAVMVIGYIWWRKRRNKQ